MTIFDYINGFWQESDREPFNTTEASLYYYLLYEANRRHWIMPFPLHTSVICFHLSVHKANLSKARDKLKKRRLIDFSKGESRTTPAFYKMLAPKSSNDGGMDNGNATDEATVTTTVNATIGATVSDTVNDTISETNNNTVYNTLSATHNKIKDKNKEKDKEKEEGDNLSRPRETKLFGVKELRERFLHDIGWQNDIIELLYKKGFSQINRSLLTELLSEFFDMLTISNVVSKTDSDCRNYFYNWVRLELTKQNKSNENIQSNRRVQRGRAEVPTASPEDYEGSF